MLTQSAVKPTEDMTTILRTSERPQMPRKSRRRQWRRSPQSESLEHRLYLTSEHWAPAVLNDEAADFLDDSYVHEARITFEDIDWYDTGQFPHIFWDVRESFDTFPQFVERGTNLVQLDPFWLPVAQAPPIG